jgi:hypothetical protein
MESIESGKISVGAVEIENNDIGIQRTYEECDAALRR